MKKILVLLALVFGFTATYAQTFNPTVKSNDVTLKTTAIVPFQISRDDHYKGLFPDVIKGQNRTTFSNDQKYIAIFQMTKEANRTVQLHLGFANTTVGGVKLTAHWNLTDKYPEEGTEGIAITSNLINWEGAQNQGWIGVRIDGLDATNATTTGTKTFTCNVTGSYIGL